MPTDLHLQLADELGVSPSEAERALADLLRDVADRARRGENVSLQGLGTFSADDEGTLRFAPSPPLQKAVNYRNEHLAPLTIGASGARPADDVEPPPEAPSPVEETSAPAEDAAFAPAEPLPADDLPDDEPTAPDVPSEAAEPPQVEEAPDEGAEEVAALSDEWTKELDEGATPPPRRRTAASETASTAQIAGLVASTGLLALLLWFVLGTQGVVPGPSALWSSSASPPERADADTVAETSAAVDEPPADEAPPSEAAEAGGQPADEAPPLPPTIDRSAGGWTIVVASRTRPQDAERILEAFQLRFRRDELPVDILTGSAGDQIRYRIAVGQYPSREAALDQMRALRDRLPDDAWPLRIRPNS